MLKITPLYLIHPENSDYNFLVNPDELNELRVTGIVPNTAFYQRVDEAQAVNGIKYFSRVPAGLFKIDLSDQSLFNPGG